MSRYNGLPGYDQWKLATPPEYEMDDEQRDEDCICIGGVDHDKWCPVHGVDPDIAREWERDDQLE